jgi:hypothetical protein
MRSFEIRRLRLEDNTKWIFRKCVTVWTGLIWLMIQCQDLVNNFEFHKSSTFLDQLNNQPIFEESADY